MQGLFLFFLFVHFPMPECLEQVTINYWGPIRGFRDTGYSRKKLPGYGIFEEKVIGIQDIEK